MTTGVPLVEGLSRQPTTANIRRIRKPGTAAPNEVTWRSRLFTWGLLVVIPVPIMAYMAVAELFLGGVELARLEIVLAYVGVVLIFAWEYMREA